VAALGWPITYMSSAVWKKALGIRVGAGKDDSRAKACQLLPLDAELWTPRRGVVNAAQAAGRTEAALIAYHGARIVAGSTRESAPAPALSA